MGLNDKIKSYLLEADNKKIMDIVAFLKKKKIKVLDDKALTMVNKQLGIDPLFVFDNFKNLQKELKKHKIIIKQ